MWDEIYNNTKVMGKKFIVLQSQRKKYRLFSEDIKTVFIKPTRKIPHIPSFHINYKAYEDDTEEEELASSGAAPPFSSQ